MLELTQTEYDLASSGVAEHIIENDSNDSDDGNATDDVEFDPTAFMGEVKRYHGEDQLDEGYNGEEEEVGYTKCTIGKRHCKVYRVKVNVNGFWDIFSIGKKMFQEANIAV